jgi:glycerophosphoryl diester phosphodiesterase
MLSYWEGVKDMTHQLALPTRGICAYRGASNTHPENTLAAFQEAVRLGAHMIEMDVQFTRDRQLVLMHEPTVDRTTNGSGAVADLTLKEIKRLDAGSWKSSLFVGEQVPTLQQVLQIMPINIWLELHLRGGREVGERVAQAIVKEERLHQTFLVCNSEAAAAALDVDLCIMIASTDQRLLEANAREMTARNKHTFLLRLKSDLMQETPELKAGSVSICYWDPDPILPEELSALYDAGVHFVVSPDVNVLVKAAIDHSIRPLKPQYTSTSQ